MQEAEYVQEQDLLSELQSFNEWEILQCYCHKVIFLQDPDKGEFRLITLLEDNWDSSFLKYKSIGRILRDFHSKLQWVILSRQFFSLLWWTSELEYFISEVRFRIWLCLFSITYLQNCWIFGVSILSLLIKHRVIVEKNISVNTNAVSFITVTLFGKTLESDPVIQT